MHKIYLVRHGQSYWNLENKFTGSCDIALTEQGRAEAQQVAEFLKGININYAFSSSLIRAQETALLALSQQGIACQRTTTAIKTNTVLSICADPRLNERSYGELEGLNKDAARKQYGPEQIKLWRRGYMDCPPGGESLFDTVARVQAFVNAALTSILNSEDNLNIVIFAHGNSIRALHKIFTFSSDSEIIKFEVNTGQVLAYQYSNGKYRCVNE